MAGVGLRSTLRKVESMRHLSLGFVALLATVENLVVFALAVLVGGRVRNRHLPAIARDCQPAIRVLPLINGLAVVSAIAINSAVTVAGFVLWTHGTIRIDKAGPRTPIDLLVIVAVTDFSLWLGHTAAHLPGVYNLAHRFHHRTADPVPVSLFVLHPIESLSFGALWLAFLTVWHTSWPALVAYAAINLAFGTASHLGVDPLPASVRRSVLFRWIATPTMHLQHHHDPSVNRGFYTTIWDRIFGTLDPSYDDCRVGAQPPQCQASV